MEAVRFRQRLGRGDEPADAGGAPRGGVGFRQEHHPGVQGAGDARRAQVAERRTARGRVRAGVPPVPAPVRAASVRAGGEDPRAERRAAISERSETRDSRGIRRRDARRGRRRRRGTRRERRDEAARPRAPRHGAEREAGDRDAAETSGANRRGAREGPRGARTRNRKADRHRRASGDGPRVDRVERVVDGARGGGGDARWVGALRGGRERGVPVPAGGDGARVDGAERTKRKSAARRYDRWRRESRRDDRRGRRRRRGGGGWARRRGRGSRGGGIIIGGGPAGPRGVGGFRPRRERRRVFFFSAAPGGRVPGSRTRAARLTGGKPFGPGGPARLATSRARRALSLRAADLGVGDVRTRARRRGGASARGARL